MAINSINKLRITGMSSGFDTDGIIKSLMQIEQLKLDRQARSRTNLLWKQEALSNISKEITAFRNKYFSVLSADNIISGSVYNSYKANVSGGDGAISAQTTVHAKSNSVTIDKVIQLASSAKAASNGKISADGAKEVAANNNTMLGYLNTKEQLFNPGENEISFMINGSSFSFSRTDTLQNMLDTVNNDETANVKMSYDRLTDRIVIESKDVGADSELHIANIRGNAFGDGNFKKDENGLYLVNDDGSLAINTGAFGIDIYGSFKAETAKYKVDDDGKILKNPDGTFQTVADGETYSGKYITRAKMQIGNGADSDRPVLVTDSIGDSVKTSSSIQQGKNAIIEVDGIQAERDSNTFEVDGIVFTLNKKTDEKTTVTISRDATDAVEKIKGFVDAYNELIGKLTGLVGERKSSSERVYVPLTDEERSAMTESEIEAWETIAKKGLLYRDSGIDSMLRKLRKSFYDTVEGTGLSAASIGLKMSSYSAAKSGQIELDETALRKALEDNPERVMSIFTQSSSSSDATEGYKENGLLNRLTNMFSQYTTGNNATSLTSLQRSISRADDQITKMAEKMQQQEEKLYQKYAAMEEALSQMESQSSWLSSLLGQAG